MLKFSRRDRATAEPEELIEPSDSAPAASLRPAPPRRFSRTLLILVALATLRLLLVAPFPFSLKYLTVDDRLYLETAQHLSEGEWLGPYNGRNLLKEIGFPLFIAGSSALGLPLRWAQELAWILACSSFFWLLRRLRCNWLTACLGTAIVLFHPAATPGNFDRILREHLYSSQILALVSLGLVVMTMTRFWQRAPWLLLLALLTVWTWHSREEGIWLAGILGLHVTVMILVDWRQKRLAAGLMASLLLAVLVASGLFAFRKFVTDMNEKHYGAAVFIESKDEDFRAALGALIRAETVDEERFYPIRNETLAKLYEVSPTLASIRPTLDSNTFRVGWMNGPNGARPTNAMGWALRAGAEQAGHHQSLPQAQAFYRQVAKELNAHLDQDPERYGPRRVSVIPPLNRQWWPEVIDETKAALVDCWTLEFKHVGDVPGAADIQVDAKMARDFSSLIGQELLPARVVHSERRNVLFELIVWYRKGLYWLAILGGLGLLIHLVRRRSFSPALAAYLVFAAVVLARALLVGALEIWFWPSRSTYLICAMPLFAAGSWLGLQAGLAALVPDRWHDTLRRLIDPTFVWLPLLGLLMIAAWRAGAEIAESGRYLEVPLQLTSRISPAEPMVMEVSFARPVASEAGLNFVVGDQHPSVFVTPWFARYRSIPRDFRIAGRAETAGNQDIVFVCYGEGTGFKGEWRQNVKLGPNGEFDLTIPLGARKISGVYLGGPFAPGSHLLLREFQPVARP